MYKRQVLIRDLFLERTTFSDFMDSDERISSNILTDRISKLRKYNLIEYRFHPNNRKIKQYYLTEAGINLYPLIYDLIVWSIDHLDMEFNPIAVEMDKVIVVNPGRLTKGLNGGTFARMTINPLNEDLINEAREDETSNHDGIYNQVYKRAAVQLIRI